MRFPQRHQSFSHDFGFHLHDGGAHVKAAGKLGNVNAFAAADAPAILARARKRGLHAGESGFIDQRADEHAGIKRIADGQMLERGAQARNKRIIN